MIPPIDLLLSVVSAGKMYVNSMAQLPVTSNAAPGWMVQLF